MLKTLLLLIAGLGAGFAIAFWLEPGAPTVAGPSLVAVERAVWPSAAPGPEAAARLELLENALADEIERRTELEARVVELATELEALGAAQPSSDGRGPSAGDSAGGEPPGPRLRRDAVALREDVQRRQVELLIAGGFAPDRAEWINRRTQELRMESLQAQYDATREGRPFEPGVALAGDRTLRNELGDTDYERYLQALNRPTAVAVQDVLASSPAERTGLRAGDEVVAYDGKRVFDMRELNALTLEGTAGESVVVDVRRDGQTIQLVMPRGPMGIMGGGGFRGR